MGICCCQFVLQKEVTFTFKSFLFDSFKKMDST